MYDRHCRNLTAEEIANKKAAGEPFVVRLRVPIGESVTFTDIIRGEVTFDTKTIDDQVLLKSDGFPTYHLANIVDDHLMDVTHVIRGEEWLPSTPKHVLLYEALEWTSPHFAHLPLLLNADRSKLSKRQGDVAVEDYKAKGYLPHALVNFVALLGWNPSASEEIFTMQQLIESFDLERVNKGGAVFNREKLDWMNSEYLRKMSASEIADLVAPLVEERGYSVSPRYLVEVVRLMQERAHTLWDFVDFASYFYAPPTDFDEKYKQKHWTEASRELLRGVLPKLEAVDVWNVSVLETVIRAYSEHHGVSAGKMIHPIRLAVTGRGMGPGLFELLEVIGKNETITRIESALSSLT
jgi:glutamyl-tRNA synthetase